MTAEWQADLDDLVKRLDEPGLVLVEELHPGRSGDHERKLHIARLSKPQNPVRSIDPDLFGPILASNRLERGPLPNYWSHPNRLEENFAIVRKQATGARRFLGLSKIVNGTLFFLLFPFLLFSLLLAILGFILH